MESGDSLIQQRIHAIKENKRLRDEGKYPIIPFYESFPKLSTVIPGIIKGINITVTANSGVGKTLFTKNLFFLTPLRFVRNHPESGIKLKIIYFLLEESKEEFIDSLICWMLNEKYNISISSLDLKSYYENPIDEKLISKIEDCKSELEILMQDVELIDSVHNPTGLYKWCRNYSEKLGTHIWEEREFQSSDSLGKSSTKEKVYKGYKPNDDTFVIVIVDHISLLSEESGGSKHNSMSKWSMDYARLQITKHWKWTVVNVQQQASDSEKMQYTLSGDTIESKVEPSLDGLGDNKIVQRDSFIILGVFAPYRYGIKQHLGYDITRLKDNYRSITILKNRLGKSNVKVPMYFDGTTMHFEEMPVLKSKGEYDDFLLKKGVV